MINFKSNIRGFTLIELVIVVAIVAILASIAIPSYHTQIQKARRADVMDAMTDCAAVQARNYTSASPPTYLTEAQLIADSLCNSAGGTLTSKEGYYTMTVGIRGRCVEANNAAWCFLLTATPVAGRSQAADTSCATWTIDHTGFKSAADSAGTDTTAICWRN